LVLARPGAADAGRVNAVLAAEEPVALAVREGHPLAGHHRVMLAETLGQDWILPFEGAVLRSVVESVLAAEGLPLPRRVLATSSFLVTLTQLGRTNAVAPLAAAVVEAFAGTG